MKRVISSPGALSDIRETISAATLSPYELSRDWLESQRFVAVAEETGRHFEAEHIERMVEVCEAREIRYFLGVSNDEPLVAPAAIAYEFSADIRGFEEFNQEFAGMNCLVVPSGPLELVVLCAVDDFHILCATREVVELYVGDLLQAKRDFEVFVHDQAEDLRPVAMMAMQLMEWIS